MKHGSERAFPRRTQVARDEQLTVTRRCVDGIDAALAGTVMKHHEGIVYLVGDTDGTITTARLAVLPDASTTPGSFRVSASAMALVVRTAAEAGLAIVGQLHTHPLTAFHSLGDFRGMRIRYPGYVSVVLPSYGADFPSWRGAEFLMCKSRFCFVRLPGIHMGGGAT